LFSGQDQARVGGLDARGRDPKRLKVPASDYDLIARGNSSFIFWIVI